LAEADPDRRRFLSRSATALGAFLAALVGFPLAGAAVAPALRRDPSNAVALGSLSDFPMKEPTRVSFSSPKTDGYFQATVSRTVWVYRTDENQAVVYSGRCTHLGCLVNYQSSSREFVCPCHGGVFAAEDGSVRDGPPPRAMDQIEHQVADGKLLITYRDFVVGIPDQKAL
jgi:Rieske Fe-S protein